MSFGFRPRQRGIQHAVGEAPFVIVPSAGLDESAFDDLGQRRIEARQMRVGIGVAEIVDRDDLDRALLPAFVKGAQYVTADAPIAIDAHSDCHPRESSILTLKGSTGQRGADRLDYILDGKSIMQEQI